MCSKVTKSRFSLRTPSCKTPTNLTVDGCSAQAQAFECLNGRHAPAVFPSYVIYSQKNLSARARLGFEPESPVRFGTRT
jgi:hypothetical protein